MVICLGCRLPDTSLRPTREFMGAGHSRTLPVWPCSGWGLPALQVTLEPGGLLPHRFTLACAHKSHRRSRFCGPIRSIRVSPDAPGDYPAPCPLELGLSSPRYREATTRTTTPIFTNYLVLPCQDPKRVGKCYLSLPLFMVMNNVLFLRFKFLHPSFKGGEFPRFFKQVQAIERACKE